MLMGLTLSDLDSLWIGHDDLDSTWISEDDLDHLDAADGSPDSVVYVDASGKVGIGTHTPSAELEVIGTVDADGFTINGTPVGTSTDSYWNLTDNDIGFPSGNVGVGTSTPDAKFQVVGGRGHDVQICGSNFALYAMNSNGNTSFLGATDYAVYGRNALSKKLGALGVDNYGVYAADTLAGSFGFLAGTHELASYGAFGKHAGGNEGALGAGLSGVYGYSRDDWGINGYTETQSGVRGQNWTSNTEGGLASPEHGVYGTAAGDSVFGFLAGRVGGDDYGAYGRYGRGPSTEGALGTISWGVYGKAETDSVFGFLGGAVPLAGSPAGAYGQVNVDTWGALGFENTGAVGVSHYGVGVHGQTLSDVGVLGENADTQTFGELGGKTRGVYGYSMNKAWGSGGIATEDEGVFGTGPTSNEGRLGTVDYGAYGEHAGSGNHGHLGSDSCGAHGVHVPTGHYGQLGTAIAGALGESPETTLGGLGTPDYGAYGHHIQGHYGYFGSETIGAYGEHINGSWGSLGGEHTGAYGENDNGNYGVLGDELYGAYGFHDVSGNYGGFGSQDYGAYGHNTTSGCYGFLGGSGDADFGVFGHHGGSGNYGFIGDELYGVVGYDGTSGNFGRLGLEYYGGWMENANGNLATLAGTSHGVQGANINGNHGLLGTDMYGVYAVNGNSNYGWIAGESVALQGVNEVSGTWVAFAGPLHAGILHGDVNITGNLHVSGTLSKSSGEFLIDHPLDPENKYLHNSFVESPDMMNVYNGNVILDDSGEATVEMPEWFEALNRDFRYQLTPIGLSGPNLYVAEEISGSRFKIAGGEAGMKVSWLVTGVRQDPYSNMNRIPVEEDKPEDERGYYLHPEAYGLSEDRGIARVIAGYASADGE
jgi:hypothetical protein